MTLAKPSRAQYDFNESTMDVESTMEFLFAAFLFIQIPCQGRARGRAKENFEFFLDFLKFHAK